MMESVHLSSLLGRNMTSVGGDRLGRLDDVIVRLRGDDYPLVTGVVARLGSVRFFLPASNLGELAAERVTVSTSEADLRPFERREGEVLLRADILGHRLVDVEDGRLLKAGDLEIAQTDEGWEVRAVDTRLRPRFFGKLAAPGRHNHKDWKQFEPLIGHVASAALPGRPSGGCAG